MNLVITSDFAITKWDVSTFLSLSKAAITLPSGNNPALMLIPVFILSPTAPVLFNPKVKLSDPAKSTDEILVWI